MDRLTATFGRLGDIAGSMIEDEFPRGNEVSEGIGPRGGTWVAPPPAYDTLIGHKNGWQARLGMSGDEVDSQSIQIRSQLMRLLEKVY